MGNGTRKPVIRKNRLKAIRSNGVILTQEEVACLATHLYGTQLNHTTVSKHESGRGLSQRAIAAYTRIYKLEDGRAVEIFVDPVGLPSEE